MARNEEKAQSMLNRFVQGKIDALRGPKEKRPYLASLCETLPEAERWRNQILGEVAKNVSMIQNTSLGEFKIRDMNDHINKLLREKRHWERRIVELGGPNYFAVSRRLVDESGAAPGGEGAAAGGGPPAAQADALRALEVRRPGLLRLQRRGRRRARGG
jgi:pre-mRNA-splicing factor ISY1